MISEIRIQNFKSIVDLTLKPGRVTVLIGENGSGKSNILEGLAFAAGAATNKLDSTFLSARGIRVTDDTWMRSAFPDEDPFVDARSGRLEPGEPISLTVKGGEQEPVFKSQVFSSVRAVDGSFAGWVVRPLIRMAELEEALQEDEFSKEVEEELRDLENRIRSSVDAHAAEVALKAIDRSLERFVAVQRLRARKQQQFGEDAGTLGLADFVIYAPENTVLRSAPAEGAMEPMGAKGEGLLKLLQSFTDERFADRLLDMKARLRVFGWFEDFLAPDETATAQARMQIRDKWLAPDRAVFDQKSANEGFLFVLFYLTLLLSWRTPRFFALDNVDNALNPKLCSTLMRQITELAKKYEKQVICTTHNPAVLDGLDLHDDEQRLYVVRRNSDGHTVLHRVRPPQPQRGETPVRLSEAFMRGIIGGLPDHF